MQRSDPPVDARPLAVLPHLGVHGEREIERRRALRQALHVAARREDEDLVLIEVDLQEFDELFRRVGILLQLDELAEPRQVAVQLVGSLPLVV